MQASGEKGQMDMQNVFLTLYHLHEIKQSFTNFTHLCMYYHMYLSCRCQCLPKYGGV